MAHTHLNNQAPAQFLIDNIDLLPVGRALDIAMGTGQNTIYLAKKGFEVEGVDISQEAISIASKSAEERAMTSPFFARAFYEANQ